MKKFAILLFMLMTPFLARAQVPQLRIGLLADIQYCACETAGTREYSKSTVKLDEAIKVINSAEVDFTVEVGDMIDRDFISFDPIITRLNKLKSKWIFVPGNHDFNVEDSLKKKVWKMIPSKKGYWSQVIGDVRIVYLNGFQNSVIAYPKGSKDQKENKLRLEQLEKEKAKNASDWNGGLGKNQLEWINKQVEQANNGNQKLVVFGHQPIIPGEEHSMWDSAKLIDVLAAYHQKVLYICGHKHAGGDHTIRNTRIINLKGMVEQPVTSFGILSVYPDRWEVKGYGLQENAEGKWK